MIPGPAVHVILAQNLVEYGLLDTIGAALTNARYRFELYVGEGNTVYVVAAVVVLLVVMTVRRRR